MWSESARMPELQRELSLGEYCIAGTLNVTSHDSPYCASASPQPLTPADPYSLVDDAPTAALTRPNASLTIGAAGQASAAPEEPVLLLRAATMLNGTLGPGMLVLPLAFARTGLAAGVGLMLAVWAASYLALLMLLTACSAQRGASVTQLAAAHGPWMALLTDGSMWLFFYGNCISYLILVGGTFSHLLAQLSPTPQAVWPLGLRGGDVLLVLFTTLLILPLSCSKVGSAAHPASHILPLSCSKVGSAAHPASHILPLSCSKVGSAPHPAPHITLPASRIANFASRTPHPASHPASATSRSRRYLASPVASSPSTDTSSSPSASHAAAPSHSSHPPHPPRPPHPPHPTCPPRSEAVEKVAVCFANCRAGFRAWCVPSARWRVASPPRLSTRRHAHIREVWPILGGCLPAGTPITPGRP